MTGTNYQTLFFVGIGGIGMSALARYFNAQGVLIMGYDRTSSPLTDQLVKENILITYKDEVNDQIRHLSSENTLVIYTPAIPDDNVLLNYFRDHDFTCQKRAEVLGSIVNKSKGIAVAGTHGKTTTASMLAHICNDETRNVNAFLGGISVNLNSNVVAFKDAEYSVVEADEFDRSFHRLYPYAAIITSVDPDHLDVYGSEKALHEAFVQFVNQVDDNGFVVVEEQAASKLKCDRALITYGYSDDADWQITSRKVVDGKYKFTLRSRDGKEQELTSGLPGIHNVANATAAFILALGIGVKPSQIINAIGTFKGVARRFDVHYKSKNHIYIDDYAHHPDELRNLIASVKEMYTGKHLTLIFQPHLYSRTRDFMDGFVAELSQVDRLVLVPIYPAREMPIEGVNVEAIKAQIEGVKKVDVVQKEELVNWLEAHETEVLVTAGAGDIDREVPKIKQWYEEKAD